jgi:hypothetical protein
MIVTFKQETADFWKEEGFEPELQFEADGYKYWAIEVPPDNKMLTSPEYLALILEEQRDYPEMIRTRFKPPVFVVMMGKRIAMTPADMKDESGQSPMVMPISRDLPLLRSIFTKPERKQTPKYLKLKRPNQIVNAMREVRQFGVASVACYMTDNIVETFLIDTIAPIIKPRVQLIGSEPDGEVARGDEEVQPVPPEEDVHSGGTG